MYLSFQFQTSDFFCCYSNLSNDDINSLRKDLKMGMEFKRPGLKTDMKNDIFWPKIG